MNEPKATLNAEIMVSMSKINHQISLMPTAEIISLLDHYAYLGQEAESREIASYWRNTHDAFMKLAEAAGRGPEISDFYDNLETPDQQAAQDRGGLLSQITALGSTPGAVTSLSKKM